MSPSRVLVTGATGFLGQHLVPRLLAEGHAVTALGRNAESLARLEALGARPVAADLAEREAVVAACEGQDQVIHAGALSSPWGPYMAFYRANVMGTRHVLEGCEAHGVGRLVHVSTPSIYFDYRDRENIREDEPLPLFAVNDYASTKREAERLVHQAFMRGLPTVTLRPRALFGPGDTAIMPRLLKAAEGGFLPLFGNEKTLVDLTVVDNVVDALLLAMQAPRTACGQAYNVTNGEPVGLEAFLRRAFEALDVPFVPRRIPYPLAYAAAGALELGSRLGLGGEEPLLTRYTLGVLAKTQTLDISAARRGLGYAPRVSLEEGLNAYADWWRAGGGAQRCGS